MIGLEEFYATIYALRDELRAAGNGKDADAIQGALSMGSSGWEIIGALRFELNRIEQEGSVGKEMNKKILIALGTLNSILPNRWDSLKSIPMPKKYAK